MSGFCSAACFRSICAFHGLNSVSSFSILFPFVLAVSLCLSAYVLWAHTIHLSIYFFVETRKTFPSLALLFSTIYFFHEPLSYRAKRDHKPLALARGCARMAPQYVPLIRTVLGDSEWLEGA